MDCALSQQSATHVDAALLRTRIVMNKLLKCSIEDMVAGETEVY